MKIRVYSSISAILLCLLITFPASAIPLYYDVTRILPADGYSITTARALNDAGQVVGNMFNFTEPSVAFVWDSSNGAQDLNDLATASVNLSQAININNAGQIIGRTDSANEGYLWSPASADTTVLGFQPIDINDSGEIISDSQYYDSISGNLVTAPATVASLAAINNNGLVAGSGQVNGSSQYYAETWDPISGVVQSFTDTSSFSTAINDLGVVVGGYFGQPGSFLFDPSSDQFLELTVEGIQGNRANAINNDGLIVGNAFDGPFLNLAVVWEFDGQNILSYDLNSLINDPLTVLMNAVDINSSGQILSLGRYNGVTSSFLLTPRFATVPSPATFWLLVLAMLIFWSQQKKLKVSKKR